MVKSSSGTHASGNSQQKSKLLSWIGAACYLTGILFFLVGSVAILYVATKDLESTTASATQEEVEM